MHPRRPEVSFPDIFSLPLRAFYSKFEHAQDKQTMSTRKTISTCLWETDEFDEPDKAKLKIDSEVAPDDDRVEFADHRYDREALRGLFMAYKFNNGRPITRSMLAWWAFQDDQQELLSLDTVFEIEHIYAKKRAEVENGDKTKLEALGNKALLEKRINIRASDYRFDDKRKYYQGFQSARGYREGTKNRELLQMAADATDFTDQIIDARTEQIIDAFMDYLGKNNLL